MYLQPHPLLNLNKMIVKWKKGSKLTMAKRTGDKMIEMTDIQPNFGR